MTNNSFCNSTAQQHYRYPLYTSVYSIVLLFGLPLNVTAIWIFLRRLGLRTATVIYMFNLAVSDLLFILSLPLRIYYFATAHWPFGNFLCIVPGVLFSVNIYSSSFLITLISVDRYLAIVHPLKSRGFRSCKAAKLSCGAVWVIIFALCFPIGTLHTVNKNKCNISRCFEDFSVSEWKSASAIIAIVMLFGVLIPFIIVSFSTVAIIKKIGQSKRNSRTVNENRLLRLVAINFGVYTICFVPLNIILIPYSIAKAKNVSLESGLFAAHIITMCLSAANSLFDPLIYYFSNGAFNLKADRQTEMKTRSESYQTT
ncbi:lysophosphatidic acid receptor 6-like [Latimeria chalumnae]|uniref:Lysophosphatidic acid receptor 5a n=1 Tax=Latimeria chalumnae TaxID=7897 RepID=H3B4U8_LATCH|nr:PREDICTED: lysophosphatidic acid receptor 6-like [Latimeria chalumnae]|eukprot:XP_005991265.1 PREDICTED: lysophosphatidic acid receptor 6-like [Latimeria chalumnae]